MGGGGILTPLPLVFFAGGEKTAARSAAKFGTAILTSIPHIVQLYFIPGQVRSGHQVTLSDLTSKNVWSRAQPTVAIRKIWNLQDFIRV